MFQKVVDVQIGRIRRQHLKRDRSNIVKQKVARNVHVIFYILSVYSLIFISGCTKGNVQESTASVAPEPTVSDAEWNNSSIEESQTTTLSYKESVTEPVSYTHLDVYKRQVRCGAAK